MGGNKTGDEALNLPQRRFLLLVVIGLLRCGVTWRRGKARPMAATPAAPPIGTRPHGAKADQEHFIAVYPKALAPTWNAGNCCGYALHNGVDDIGCLRARLEKLESDYAFDRKRIYFTGISNGAMMSYRVACEMSGQIAAIAPVEGALNVDCHPPSPLSIPGRPPPVARPRDRRQRHAG